MRLTTLARKTDKTPTQLIAFLEENKIEITNGPHSKLDAETVDMVMSHFLPEEISEDVSTPNIEAVKEDIEEASSMKNVPDSEEDSKPIVDVEKPEPKKASVLIEEEDEQAEAPVGQELIIEQKTGTIDDLEDENQDEIELIKAKKVKLDGIKVVGKIELPEKPKKDTAKEDKAETAKEEIVKKPKKKLKAQNGKFDHRKRKNQRDKNRNPLTYDEKLKREEREKLRKRRQKKKEEKRRKQKYYQENIQPKTTQNPRKKKKKQTLVQSLARKKVVVHKNPIKRLWAWLNGKYDHY